MNVLAFSSRKAKRISHSTSHAETLSCVSSVQTAQLAALRLTEVYWCDISPRPCTLQSLMALQDSGRYLLPCDHISDCLDLFMLVTGQKGISSDKNQRLAVLSIREDRLSGRIRRFIHLPTRYMLPDGLTKPGVFPGLLEYCTTGWWTVAASSDKPLRMRELAPQAEFDEKSFVELKG